MASLLGNGFDDPQSAAIMALAGGLLRRDFGGGLLAANSAFGEAKQNAARQQMAQMQMQEMQMRMADAQRQRALEEQLRGAAQQSFITPDQATAASMGPMPDGSNMPTVQPGFDVKGYGQRLMAIDPMKGLQWQQATAKDESPLSVAPGASLVDRKTLKPIFTAPKEQSLPSAIQEYQFAQGQGYKGTFEQWDRERKKAGANNVSLSVNTEKNLLNDIAGGLGKSIVDARTAAQGAQGTINTVSRLNEALNSGKVMAGPGTSFRQLALQLGNNLGVAGNSAQETLLNTRQAIQSLAQLELDAAQQMKGQGQITEAERSIIRRAASGDIDGMTVPELRVLSNTLDKTARYKIQSYNRQVQPLAKNPNAAPIAPFLNVDEPAGTPANAPGVRRYNPATGRIE